MSQRGRQVYISRWKKKGNMDDGRYYNHACLIRIPGQINAQSGVLEMMHNQRRKSVTGFACVTGQRKFITPLFAWLGTVEISSVEIPGPGTSLIEVAGFNPDIQFGQSA